MEYCIGIIVHQDFFRDISERGFRIQGKGEVLGPSRMQFPQFPRFEFQFCILNY